MDLFAFFIQAIEREPDMRPLAELELSVDKRGFDGDADPAEAPGDTAELPFGDFTFPEEGDRHG